MSGQCPSERPPHCEYQRSDDSEAETTAKIEKTKK